MIENEGIELPQCDWDCDHNVFTSCLCLIFSFLLPHGKEKKRKKSACVRKKRRLNCTNHSGKDREVVTCDRRKMGGRGKKSTFTQSSLSLSEVAPKEVANVRPFPNVTDAHPTPRLPLDALLQGLPSLARIAYTAGNSFFQHCFKSTQQWPPALMPLFANHPKKYLKYTYFLLNGELFTFLRDYDSLRKASK